jgi:hypothetical protein
MENYFYTPDKIAILKMSSNGSEHGERRKCQKYKFFLFNIASSSAFIQRILPSQMLSNYTTCKKVYKSPQLLIHHTLMTHFIQAKPYPEPPNHRDP